MIQYDSHEWDIYYKRRGSIFPKAILFSLPSALLAFGISYLELLSDVELSPGQGIFSGFTFVLGFILVFRTSQSYQRYWHAATSVHNMKAEWCDACGSLIAFAQTSKMGTESIMRFSHTMIRLFGLMHAMALEEMSGVDGQIQFPLLDIDGLEKEDLKLLTTGPAQGRTVEIVCQWIKVTILRNIGTGVLDVPAPILTRVFQELGTGLVNYHEAVQVVIWPFPFPYAQMGAVLILVYMCVTPIIICTWSDSPYYCFTATFVSLVCMRGLEMIAVELENPFGTDPNDLPLAEMNAAVNRDLSLLVNPRTWQIPQLLDSALVDYDELMECINCSMVCSKTLGDIDNETRKSSGAPRRLSRSSQGSAPGQKLAQLLTRQRTNSVSSDGSRRPLPKSKTPPKIRAQRARTGLLGAVAAGRRAKQRKMTNWHNNQNGEECDATKERTAGMLGICIDAPSGPRAQPRTSTSPSAIDAPARASVVSDPRQTASAPPCQELPGALLSGASHVCVSDGRQAPAESPG